MRLIPLLATVMLALPSQAEAPKLGGRVQVRADITTGDDATLGHLLIPRARFAASAKDGFGKGIGYKFQVDFGKGKASLKDFYIDMPLFSRDGIRLWAGQGKKPFSRHHLTSSGRLALVDRAFTDKLSGSGRDVGLYLHNNRGSSPKLEWALGLFNGLGPNTVPGKDGNRASADPQIVARVGFNSSKFKGYSEVDLKGGPLRYAVAASVMSTPGTAADLKAEFDFIVKVNGISATGGFNFDDGESEHSQAIYVQASKTFGQWVPALRYAKALSGDDGEELRVGFGRFIKGHKLKWQSSFGLIDGEERQILSQLQLVF